MDSVILYLSHPEITISEYFSDNNIMKCLKLFGINDMFIQHGTRDELLKDLHLDEESITLYIKKIIENNE